MKISIVLATYNGERFVREQLQSFVDQTRLPDELVVCDDDSKDSTWAILNEFAESAPFPVRLFRNERNLGYCANFVKAIGLAQGDLIFMSDQDDVWLPQKLARMTAVFDSPDVMVVTCDQEAADESMNPSGHSALAVLRASGGRPVLFTIGCCTALRSSMRTLMLPLPAGVAMHDGWLDVLATSLDVRRTLPEVLQYHRSHGNNLSPDHLHRPPRISRFASLRRTFAISPDQKLFQYDYYEAVIQRLTEVPESEMPLGARRQRAVAFAEHRLTTLRERHALAVLPRRRRIAGVVRLLRSGSYQQFSGWKSAVKDALAKPVSQS